jgi:hypothetical protein
MAGDLLALTWPSGNQQHLPCRFHSFCGQIAESKVSHLPATNQSAARNNFYHFAWFGAFSRYKTISSIFVSTRFIIISGRLTFCHDFQICCCFPVADAQRHLSADRVKTPQIAGNGPIFSFHEVDELSNRVKVEPVLVICITECFFRLFVFNWMPSHQQRALGSIKSSWLNYGRVE